MVLALEVTDFKLNVEVDQILMQFADFRLCNLVIAVIKISKNIMLEVCMKVWVPTADCMK